MIHYGHQSLSDSDFELVLESLKGEYLTNGPLLEEFESKLNHETDAHCIAVSSGTAALHTAYSAIGVTSGDEVITPPITFIATQATAVSLGATIKFVDVDPDTGLLDVNQVEKAISKKTKAIVTVDYGGCQADLFKLKAMIEIKPDAQTRPPAKKSRQTRKYITEVSTYLINNAK